MYILNTRLRASLLGMAYVNTGGDTGRKYDHIMLMNDSLQLGLTVSMV